MSARYVYDASRPFGQRFVQIPLDWRPPVRKRLQIVGDQHAPFKSMADGQMYDSKSRYRAEIKARGFEEVGNEMQECTGGEFEPSDWRDDLAETASEYGVNLEDAPAPKRTMHSEIRRQLNRADAHMEAIKHRKPR